MKGRQEGFAIVMVLALLVLSIVVGAFILKSARHRSGAASNYFQARSAELAAQAGLQAGLATLEANPAEAVVLLNNFLKDPAKAWLFNGTAGAGTRTTQALGSQKQRYAARIVAFDPATATIKLRSEGEGPGGGQSRATGVFRMDGVAQAYPDLARYGWYMAGETRNVDQAVDVTGDAYFGGDVHFNGGANGSVFRGTLKVARGAGNTSSFDAQVTFMENAFFDTPLRSQGSSIIFQKDAGFGANLSLDADFRFTGSGRIAYLNANVNGGNSRLDMAGNAVRHSGSLNTARVANASQITNMNGTIPIAANLQMKPAAESELTVDLSGVPAAKRFTPASLGIGPWGFTNGLELSAAYASARSTGKLHREFLFLTVNQQLDFNPVAGNVLSGKFVFVVGGTINMNGNLPHSDPASVSLYHVVSGGRIQGFGGTGLFRGYVNVAGTGNVLYQWGAGSLCLGAVHHVSPNSGFQLNSTGAKFTLEFDKGVFDAIAPLGILTVPGSPSPVVTPEVKLIDTRLRPRFLASHF